jgi:bifunctional enzyme CysN/CysC
MSGLARTQRGAAQASQPLPLRDLDGIVHILTCGYVDDGKSTLIGRLLWDASDLPDDQR